MAEIYGHRWTSQYGETDTDGTWARGLVGITGAQLAAGLQRCVNQGNKRAQNGEQDWPPSLGEFRGYCLPEKPRYIGTDYVKLPKPEIPEEQRTKIRQELYSAVSRQAPDQPPKLEDVK